MSSQNNDIPEGFRMTGLGLLPKDWELMKLGEICSISTGKKDVDQGNPEGLYPFFSCARRIYRSDTYSFDCEAILIAGNGDVGSVKYYNGKFEAYQRTYVLHNCSQVTNYVYFYLYGNIKKELVLKKSGSTMPYIRKGDLTSFVLPLPPLPEQKAIARVLSTIQKAIEAQGKIIAAAREMKKSIMCHLFTYGPVPVAEAEQVHLKETEIGPVPAHWEVKRISEICQVKGSTISLPELIEKDTKDFNHVIVHGIKVSDMTLAGNEREITKANIEARLPEHLAKKVSIPPNSVVFPKRGAAIATNKKRLVTTWTALDPNLIAVSPKKEVNCYYLLYWFMTIDIATLQNPGPTPQLNRKDVDPVLMPLPSWQEQNAIIHILSLVDKKIEAEENRKAALQALFKTMLHQLMTGKVRVRDLEVTAS